MQLSFVSSCGFNIPRVIIDGVDDITVIRNVGSIIINGIEVGFESPTSTWWLLVHCNVGGTDILFRTKLASD